METDWQVGPRNRWAYVHVEEVVATVPVARGDAVTPFDDAPEALDLNLDAFDGLAVVRDGVLIHEAYQGEMHAGSRHLSQSVAKSVLGLLAGILAGDGRLDPAEPITSYVPEVGGSGYEGATVRHLLEMTAAIDFVEDYEAFVRYDAACGWHPPIDGAPGSILDFLPTIGPVGWAHGERFHYASPNTDLLGLVVERAGGAPLPALLSAELWAPMGAEQDALLAVDPAGTHVISGGFCATLRDYARLGMVVADHGRGIVPGGWIEGLGIGDPDALANATVSVSADGYGNHWWRRDRCIAARGIHGQLIAVHPKTRTVIVVLSSWPTATSAKLDAAQRALVRRLI